MDAELRGIDGTSFKQTCARALERGTERGNFIVGRSRDGLVDEAVSEFLNRPRKRKSLVPEWTPEDLKFLREVGVRVDKR